jgi:hypothetical protein
MTESEWTNASDPHGMLEYVGKSNSGSERKRRLFACACVRRLWPYLEEGSRKAVEMAELFADGLASEAELDAAELDAEEVARLARQALTWPPDESTQEAVKQSIYRAEAAEGTAFRNLVLEFTAGSVLLAVGNLKSAEERYQCSMLRCIFGALPYCPQVTLDHSRLVMNLAQAAYENRRPDGALESDRLAILADAFEDSSLADEAILLHLRSEGPHYRGCHVLDAILGKS